MGLYWGLGGFALSSLLNGLSCLRVVVGLVWGWVFWVEFLVALRARLRFTDGLFLGTLCLRSCVGLI